MKFAIRFPKLVAITVVLVSMLTLAPELERNCAIAQEKRKSYPMPTGTHRRLGKIERAYAAGNIDEALLIAEEGLQKHRKNQYSNLTLWQWISKLRRDQGGSDAVSRSIEAYEKALEAARKINPEALEIMMLMSLSQMNFQHGNHLKALDYFKQWAPRDKVVRATHLAYASQLYYALGNYKAAAKYMSDGFLLAEGHAATNPQPLWTDIAVSANWELGNYDEVEKYLVYQLEQWPGAKSQACKHYAALRELVGDTTASTADAFAESVCDETVPSQPPKKLVMNNPISLIQPANPEAEGCLPIVRIQPQYPVKAQKRGIEGFVVVSMDTQDDGWVEPDSVRVVEAQPKGYFEKAAIRAARKMRYRSELLDNETRCRTGMTYKFTFGLAN